MTGATILKGEYHMKGLILPDVAETPGHLTAREIEVLTPLFEGKSSREVAKELFISKHTVDFHLASIYNKLGVGNRMQAFREAARRGLVTPAAP